MKEDKIAICRLCLNLTESGCYDLLDDVKNEMLAIVLPELNLAVTSDPVVCKCCSENLQKSYDFKTEYLNYYRNVLMETNNPEYRIKCALCSMINKKLNNIKDDVLLKEMLEKCFSKENIMENIAVCETCLEPLQNQYNFVMKCLDVEEKLGTYAIKNADNAKVNLFNVFQAEGIKRTETINLEGPTTELVTLKKESIDFCGINSPKKVKMECIDNMETDYQTPELVSVKEEGIDFRETNSTKDVRMEGINIKSENAIEEEDVDIKSEKEDETYVMSSKKIYKCDQCDYQTFRKTDLTLRHILRHKKPEELRMYKCTECSYQSKRSGDLNSHLAIHTDSVPVYRCDNCRYKTIHKSRLKEHLLKHNLPGKYQCEFCSYSASYKKPFMQHVKSHRRPKKKELYKCEFCPYETKRRTDLTDKHMLIHRTPDELVMHKCMHCDFQAKHKCSLKRHELKHMSPQGIIKYECPDCDFKTIQKRYLTSHLLTHKKPDEFVMYKCDLCPYVSKHKAYVRKHRKLHEAKDSPQFKCSLCSYQTNAKNNYQRHINRATHAKAMSSSAGC